MHNLGLKRSQAFKPIIVNSAWPTANADEEGTAHARLAIAPSAYPAASSVAKSSFEGVDAGGVKSPYMDASTQTLTYSSTQALPLKSAVAEKSTPPHSYTDKIPSTAAPEITEAPQLIPLDLKPPPMQDRRPPPGGVQQILLPGTVFTDDDETILHFERPVEESKADGIVDITYGSALPSSDISSTYSNIAPIISYEHLSEAKLDSSAASMQNLDSMTSRKMNASANAIDQEDISSITENDQRRVGIDGINDVVTAVGKLGNESLTTVIESGTSSSSGINTVMTQSNAWSSYDAGSAVHDANNVHSSNNSTLTLSKTFQQNSTTYETLTNLETRNQEHNVQQSDGSSLTRNIASTDSNLEKHKWGVHMPEDSYLSNDVQDITVHMSGDDETSSSNLLGTNEGNYVNNSSLASINTQSMASSLLNAAESSQLRSEQGAGFVNSDRGTKSLQEIIFTSATTQLHEEVTTTELSAENISTTQYPSVQTVSPSSRDDSTGTVEGKLEVSSTVIEDVKTQSHSESGLESSASNGLQTVASSKNAILDSNMSLKTSTGDASDKDSLLRTNMRRTQTAKVFSASSITNEDLADAFNSLLAENKGKKGSSEKEVRQSATVQSLHQNDVLLSKQAADGSIQQEAEKESSSATKLLTGPQTFETKDRAQHFAPSDSRVESSQLESKSQENLSLVNTSHLQNVASKSDSGMR